MLRLLRMATGRRTTLGHLYLNGMFLCYILEDLVRPEKIAGETAIPAGVYTLGLNTVAGMNGRYGNRYGKLHRGMVEVRGIPNFSLVFFHIGNYHTDTRGCLLTGSYFQLMNGDYRVLHSADAYKRIYPLLADLAVKGESLEVKDVFNGKEVLYGQAA